MKINPTVYVRLPGDEVCKQIVGRSILIKEIISVYSEAQLTRKNRVRSRDRDDNGEEEEKKEG